MVTYAEYFHLEVAAWLEDEERREAQTAHLDDPVWLAAQGDWDAFVKQVTR